MDGKKAVGSDAANQAAKFVHVGVDHDARAGGALCGDDGAEAVVGEVIGEGRHALNHDFANRFFIAGRAGRFRKCSKEFGGGVLGTCGSVGGDEREREKAEQYDEAAR